MKNRITLLIAVFFITTTHAQLKIQKLDSTKNNLETIINSLTGDGVVITGASSNQTPTSQAFGVFNDEARFFGLKDGIIATTGSVDRVAQFNQYTGMTLLKKNGSIIQEGWHNHSFVGTRIPELEKVLGNSSRTVDGVVLEFDIIPMADTLAFIYLFGSEEYDEYVCSEFNDVFAFFISGPEIEGEKNIALLPDSETPVSINNVNNGNSNRKNCQSQNPTFYQQNLGAKIEYDGFTRLLEVKQKVKPFEQYHIKICIADVGDDALDSGVLLENTSIVSFHDEVKVFFEKNSAKLSESYKTRLNSVTALMKMHDSKSLVVSGHTDSDGSEEFNLELSDQRIKSVVNYLSDLGIQKEKIVLKGRGEQMPSVSNYNMAGKASNRRVDVRLLGNNEHFHNDEINNEIGPYIEQNFPNPFQDQTTIRYFIPESSKSSYIEIRTMNGQLTDKILLLETGKGEVLLSGADYPAGTYIMQLVIDERLVKSKKIVKI